LDATNHAALTYYRYGSSGTFSVFDAQSYNDWTDVGSTASLSNASSGSTSTHRWFSSGTTSWVINDASARTTTYWVQLKVTITTTGLNPSHPATIAFTQYGVVSNSATSATWSDWADAGSAVSISGSVYNGEWSTGDTTSWIINSPISATVNYHQHVTLSPGQEGLSGGAIAGIVVGSCAAAVGIYLAVKKWVWKR
jgi:hypothetical protein